MRTLIENGETRLPHGGPTDELTPHLPGVSLTAPLQKRRSAAFSP